MGTAMVNATAPSDVRRPIWPGAKPNEARITETNGRIAAERDAEREDQGAQGDHATNRTGASASPSGRPTGSATDPARSEFMSAGGRLRDPILA